MPNEWNLEIAFCQIYLKHCDRCHNCIFSHVVFDLGNEFGKEGVFHGFSTLEDAFLQVTHGA